MISMGTTGKYSGWTRSRCRPSRLAALFHGGNRPAGRWGKAHGSIVIHGQKVPIERPRVRGQDGELKLGSYELFRQDEDMRRQVVPAELRRTLGLKKPEKQSHGLGCQLRKLNWRWLRPKLMGMIANAFQWHEYQLQARLREKGDSKATVLDRQSSSTPRTVSPSGA